MNSVLTPFRQLVDRKLWPVAVLLIAALAAVPVLLAKDSAPEAVAPLAGTGVAATTAESATQPIVTLGQAADREASRKVLGARKNPFRPAVVAKKADADATPTTTTTTALGGDANKAGSGGGGSPVSSGGGGSATSGTGSPAPVVNVRPVAPTVTKPTYELFQLKIRFGATSSEDLATRSIKRLTALPTTANPVLSYLGLKSDQRTAVFMVAANTLVVGNGKCDPSPANCQTLELKKGQTAFVDTLDPVSGSSTAQYQLDHVKVLQRTTTDAKVAKAARLVVAKGGRDALRANISRVNGWHYVPALGFLIRPADED